MSDVSLSLLVLKTHQADGLRCFYGTLGIEFEQEQHEKGPVHFAGRIGHTVMEIYPLRIGEKADATTRLGFVVRDLNETLELLRKRQPSPIAELRKTEWGIRAVVRDPDGRTVELYDAPKPD